MSYKAFGQLVKKDYPEYSDMTDEEVGQKTALIKPDWYSKFQTQTIKTLYDKYSPEQGRFSAWRQKLQSKGRGKLLEALNNEQRLFLEQAAMMEQYVLAGQRSRAEYELFLAQSQLIIQAVEQGMTVETMQQVKLAEARTEEYRQKQSIDFHHEQTAKNLETERELRLAEQKLKEYKEKAEHDLKMEVEKAQEALRLEIIADHLVGHQKVVLLQELIDEQYVKIDEIKRSTIIPEGAKEDIIESRKRVIEMFMKQQDEIPRLSA